MLVLEKSRHQVRCKHHIWAPESDKMKTYRIDETGKRYGSLVALKVRERSLSSRFKRSKAKWVCRCDCGRKTDVFGDKLRSGHITMCLVCERTLRNGPMSVLIKNLRKEQSWGNMLDGEAADAIEKLQGRIILLEGYLRGALDVVEAFSHTDTSKARFLLEGEKSDK